MIFFKKRTKLLDERLENSKNKIYKEAFFIVQAICFLSIIVKDLLYEVNLKAIAIELLIIIIPLIYTLIRTIYLGIYSDEVELHDRTNKISITTKSFILGIVLGICMALFFGLRSAFLYGTTTAMRLCYFISVFIVCFFIYVPLYIIVFIMPVMLATKTAKKQSSDKDN